MDKKRFPATRRVRDDRERKERVTESKIGQEERKMIMTKAQ